MPGLKNLSLPSRVQQFIEKEKLLSQGQSIICAVSGGLDSIVLATILKNLGYKLNVAHFNFGLREADSIADEEFVKNWAAKNNFPFYGKSVDKAHFEGKSVQEEARKLRYEWFTNLAEILQIETICTAHQADDQIETIFLQMLRGTGLKGMRGILPKQENLVRPLLCIKKRELEAYAIENKITWREDASNQKSDYKRNKIRLQLLPVLENISPGFEEVIQRNAEKIKLYEEATQVYYHQLYVLFIINKNIDFQEFDWEKIKEHPSGKFFLMEFLSRNQFPFDSLAEMWNSLFSTECKQWKNGKGQIVEIKENQFYFWPIEFEPIEIEIIEPGTFSISKEKTFTISVIENYKGNFSEIGKDVAFVDFSKIEFPCKLQNWEQGDEIFSFGLKGKKRKVSDLLTYHKLTLEAKKRTLKLEDKQGRIIWIPGIESSFQFKVEENSKLTAKLSYTL
jgi:tRNA(Ile)-lysidine synthase